MKEENGTVSFRSGRLVEHDEMRFDSDPVLRTAYSDFHSQGKS